jgi:hypothetical protein
MATTNKAFRVKTGLIVEGAELKPAQGTSSYPPILLTAGTNLGTASAGAFEYDGTNFYLTPASTRKTIAFTDLIPAAGTSTVLGTIKLFSDTAQSVTATAVSTTASRTYGLQVNASGQGVVNVPWTDTVYSLPLATDTARGGIQLFSATQQSVAANAVTSTASRTYGIQVNSAEQAVVNVPWTDTDTNYYPTAVTMTAGTTAGPTVDLTMSGTSNITGSAIPSATASASGVVTTAAQTFAGAKTFNSIPLVASNAGGNGNGTPTQALELVNKQYVDNIASGINAHDAVIAATTTALTATYSNGTSGVGATLTNSGTQAALVIDNVSLTSGDRVLVKNQATTFQNGIYYVTTVGTVSTNWVLTRASDYDQSIAGEVAAGDTTFVIAPVAQFSTTPTNQNTGWTMNSPGTISIGSSAITFAQSSGSGTVTAGTGINVTGNSVAVDSSVLTTTSTQTGITNKTFTSPAVTTSLTTGSSSFDLLNTTATTINFAGAATTLAIGGNTSTSSTVNLGLASNVTSGQTRTVNIATDVAGTGANVTVNLATSANTTNITLVNVGHTSTTTTITGTVKLPTVGTSGFVRLGANGQLSADTNTYVGAASPALTGTPTINSIGAVATSTFTTSGTTAGTSSTIFSTATYTGAEIVIKAVNSTTIEIIKALVVIDSSGNVYNTQYANIQTGTQLIGTLDYTTTSGNFVISITPFAGTTGTTTYKAVLTLIAA